MTGINVLEVQDLGDGSYVTVYEQGIYRIMAITEDITSEGLIQGRIIISRPDWLPEEYSRTIVCLAAGWGRLRSITVMGLGAGGQFRSFRRDYPQATIQVVERFSVVVVLAEKYFLEALAARCQYHCEDYIAYFNRPAFRNQDLVVVDVFTHRSRIEEMANIDFFLLAGQMLSGMGVLIINLVGTPAQIDNVFEAAVSTFPYLYRYDLAVTPNTILVASLVAPFRDTGLEGYAYRG